MSTCLLITTMNRTPLLEISLQRLKEHTLPDEILVVDDGGSDGCDTVCARLRDEGLPMLRYIHNDNPGVSICSFARNVGIKSTDAEIVVTSEPEVIFLTDVIAQLLVRHRVSPDDVISAGTVFHAQSEGVLDPGLCHRIEGWVAPFTALYERQWLIDIGGWDESFPGSWGWDDTDLLSRLRFAGHGQIIDREVEILHQWHPRNQDPQHANEQHFFSKSFHRDPTDTSDLVANKGRAWGLTSTS